MNPVSLLHSHAEEDQLIESYLRGVNLPEGQQLMILEAGCGRKWPHNLSDVPHVLTGVDLDKRALEIRQTERKDLHIAIHGDLRTVDLPPDTYHVIFNSFVLEHIQGAEALLDRFLMWLKPGGLLIIRFPDRNTAYGMLTRLFPFQFHVLYRRIVEGDPLAGTPGHDPYPTYHEKVVSRHGFRDFLSRRGLLLLEEKGHGHYLKTGGIKHWLARSVAEGFSLVTFGGVTARYNNLLFIAEKPLNWTPAKAASASGQLMDKQKVKAG